MELEQVLPEISQEIDGKALLEVSRKFADVLTEETWDQDSNLSTKIQREFKNLLVIPVLDTDNQVVMKERQVIVNALFTAEKIQVDFDEKTERPEFEEIYTIGASIREIIQPHELPDWIITKVREKIVLHGESDDSSSTLEIEDFSSDMLQGFTFEKVLGVEYVVDETGELDDYTVTCSYLCDDWLVDQAQYSWSDGEMMATAIDEETPVEFKPKNEEPITEAEINEFQESFDTIILAMTENADEEGDAFTKLEQDESEASFYTTEETHCRRALGMIALNSRRFVGMNIK